MSELRRSSRATVRSAVSLVCMGALVLAGSLASCLVTNQVNYDQTFINSTLKQVEPATEFAAMPVEADEQCELLGSFMRFEVEISDLNREEDLKLRVVVNKQVVLDYDVFANGKELRELDPPFFCLDKRVLNDSCNLVEALVSSSIPSRRDKPYAALDGDLAIAHWWIIGNAEDNPNASYLDCPDPGPDDAGAP